MKVMINLFQSKYIFASWKYKIIIKSRNKHFRPSRVSGNVRQILLTLPNLHWLEDTKFQLGTCEKVVVLLLALRSCRFLIQSKKNNLFLLQLCINWPFKWKGSSMLQFFYTPVFRRDVLWYGDIRLSVRVSVRPSVHPPVTVFRTFLLHALRYWAEILCVTLFWCM